MARVVWLQVSRVIFLCVAALSTVATAEEPCSAIIRQSDNNTIEVLANYVRVKIESDKRWVKMKLPEAFGTFSWTWASTKNGVARIDGYIQRGGGAHLVAQLVASYVPANGIQWILFERPLSILSAGLGMAYLSDQGRLLCKETSLSDWQELVSELFGSSFADVKSVSAVAPQDAYKKLGL